MSRGLFSSVTIKNNGDSLEFTEGDVRYNRAKSDYEVRFFTTSNLISFSAKHNNFDLKSIYTGSTVTLIKQDGSTVNPTTVTEIYQVFAEDNFFFSTPSSGNGGGGGNGNGGNSNGLTLEDLFTVDRDLDNNIIKTNSIYDFSVPPESIDIGNSITMSDLAQELSYRTNFDDRRYIMMAYEITDQGSKNPVLKQYNASTEFELQPLFDETQVFNEQVQFNILSIQDVLGVTYNLKVDATGDILLQLVRVADAARGVDTLVVEELLPQEILDGDGFNFDLKPIVDFVANTNYILILKTGQGQTITVKGTTINGNFSPYIKRVVGYEYTKVETLPFTEEIKNKLEAKDNYLYMRLNSVQDINITTPFVDLDFVAVTNTIEGATVSSNFQAFGEVYKGVVTLPAGKYKSSFKVSGTSINNARKVVVMNISRYLPSVIFYPDSTVYELFRSENIPSSLSNPDANYQFLELTQTESFGIISARVGAAGSVETLPDQSFWKIEKIE